ncbi:G protein-coupled receptor [Aphelenchoides besseyi]|nr:G protein-coupled receptor [Aphelenchoides besseyi]KAI6231392.1 G protein-coupled receptor [Aphelenchoides besseyi]
MPTPEERERIEKAGGFVEFYGVERVQGILAVSRAFGDTAFKRWVIVRPEVVRLDLRESPLRYVVLASDGFWDVVKSYEAVLEVNYLLDRGQTDIADHLVQLALKRKSADNISVFFSMEESQRSYSMDSWNQTIFTAESQISVSRLNRVTYGYITPLIISFGVVGDVLTVATLTHPLLRRAGIIYTYLTLLAMTDLFTHISVIPMVLWILDVRLCSKSSAFYYAHIGFPLSNALMSASVWIVVFLTFSQYMAVCQPFHRGFLRKRRLCFWLFAFAYIFSFCIYAPWATKKSVHHIPAGLLTCPYVICDRKIETFFFAYEWVREFFTRVFPFILIAYMNTKILLTYKNTKKDRQKRLAHSTKTQQSEQEERRLFFLLFAIIIVFFLCTIPAAPLTIFVADDRSQNWTFQFIRACVNLLEFTKFALNFYFYCLINPDIRRICIHMIQCQKFGKLPRVKGQPVNPISVYTRSTKSTIRGFASANDEFSRRNSQRHIDDDYRKSIDVKVHRSASLLSQYYCETPSEFDHLTIIRESEDSLIDATERERLPSYASAAPSPAPPRTSDGCFLALPR